ncbi:hypothetical protein FB468_0833 [Leucobacter komagatae]|uniref:Uncharacterized protein n=1 Tax=Leucobacter komagatae TaxID=55969 RepID=A0A542Y420_9MICO|nr:hypothetical protein [Leucobacter komagatae]TQL42825.1 hypothetical protein FB468_0833 [Leucobacter komagatae]
MKFIVPLEVWIVAGGLVVLAICVWRVWAWTERNPGAITSQLPPQRYRRVQLALFALTSVMMGAVLAVFLVWRDLPFWGTLLCLCWALLLLGLARSIVIARIWRCGSCRAALPTRMRRSGTNPANVLNCPSCGAEVAS